MLDERSWWRGLRLGVWGLWVVAINGEAHAAEAVRIGEPASVENLTVFAVHGAREDKPVALTTLEAALAKGDAEVREVSDGGQVNTLQIHNRGKLPIYVLAGTVVQGGKQDRQIGQDFVIDAGKQVAVDAYCVERGRWSAEREGKHTSGKFGETKGLAASKVRRAAQYARNQTEVWDKVSEVNAAHKKSAPSSTLLATLDDAEVTKRRAELVRAIDLWLRAAEAAAPVVGIAYAVDGEVRNVRWFQSPGVFALFRTNLLEAAALDALTAQAHSGRRDAAKVEKAAVDTLIGEIERGAAQTRETPAQNRNEYREGQRGFGSKTRLKSAPASAAPISSDYTAK